MLNSGDGMKLTNEIISLASELGIEIPNSDLEYEVLASIASQVGLSNYSYSPSGNSDLYDKLVSIRNQMDNNPEYFNDDSIDESEDDNSITPINQYDQHDSSTSSVGSNEYDNINNRLKKEQSNFNNESIQPNNLKKNQYNNPNKKLNAEKSLEDSAKTEIAKKTEETAGKKIASEGAKKAASEGAKKTAETAAVKAGSEKAAKSWLLTLIKNPYFWMVVGIVTLVIILVIFVVLLINSSKSNVGFQDRFPYVKMDFSENVKVKTKDGIIHEWTLDEATAAVLYHEDKDLTKSMEYLKARAVASRSRILWAVSQSNYKKDGYYTSDNNLGFSSSVSKNSVYQQAADETSGIILVNGSTSNPKFAGIEWDNITHKSSCGGKETDDSFVVCQKSVEVSFDFLKKYSAYSIDHWRKQSAHGRGMSQWGAYYLAIEKEYDAEKLLKYFYSSNTIISLYPNNYATDEPSTPDSGGCTINPKVTPSSAKEFTKSLKSLLNSKGTSIKEFNNGLRDAVAKAGPGTRCGVVTAAMYTIEKIGSYGVRIPYMYGGTTGMYTYGAHPDWGTPYKKCVNGYGCYYHKGLDCGTFLPWVFKNGGVNMTQTQVKYMNVKKYSVKASNPHIGKPGDVLWHSGHVMLILKHAKKGGNEGYYVAEFSGRAADAQIKFSKLSSLKKENYYVVDMSYYYKHKGISKKKYISAFNSGRKG
ncbi:MAG: hypothetical protein IKX00_04605 [Bacilli bacterium]|nr:hypothetical protein [Bacilli bacterium]